MTQLRRGEIPGAIVPKLRMHVRRSGAFAWLVCGGCGRPGDVERDVEALAAMGVRHSLACPVMRELYQAGGTRRRPAHLLRFVARAAA